MFDESKLEFIQIPYNREIITDLEELRADAFGKIMEDVYNSTDEFLLRNLTGIMTTYEKEPIAGCYVSSHAPTLYIPYLFVKPDFQRKKYYIGKKTLLETLKRKRNFEKYYHEEFDTVEMIAKNKQLQELYLSWGFNAPYKTLLVRKKI